jgi:hypothetical protein
MEDGMSEEDEQGSKLTLHGGYAVEALSERKLLQLTAPDGRVCLQIALGPQGLSVQLTAAALAVATEGDVSVDCERFLVNARQEIVTEAVAQHHRARLGGIDLVANDDVSLKGERVRLNSPDLRKQLPAMKGGGPALTQSSSKHQGRSPPRAP